MSNWKSKTRIKIHFIYKVINTNNSKHILRICNLVMKMVTEDTSVD